MTKCRIFVAGTGAFGTTLALLGEANGHEVTLFGRDPQKVARLQATRENEGLLPGIRIPDGIRITADPSLARDQTVLITAIPTAWLEPTLAPLIPHLAQETMIVSLTKGIDSECGERPSELLTRAFPGRPVAVLSGPSHAEEVARGIPSSVVLAAEDAAVATALQDLLATERFRIYTNDDVIGVELAGALKNVIALAAGICDGLGFGDNTKSALLTRGMVEMARLGEAMGARRETFFGLAGIGDLMTSAFSRHGRNRMVGERLGRGESLTDVLANMQKVAEGVHTARAVQALSSRHSVELPISAQVAEILFESKDPAQALQDLLNRARKSETL